VGGASSVGLIPTGSDAVFAGLTTAAAHTIDPSYNVNPLSNYFFSASSSIVLALSNTMVVELVVAKRAATPEGAEPSIDAEPLPDRKLKPAEQRGMGWAGIATVLFFGLLVLAVLPADSPPRRPRGSVLDSPLMNNIAVIMMLFFATVGVVYGVIAGSITKFSDIPELMAPGVAALVPVMVLFFAASQFLAYFKWTNIGQVIAIDRKSTRL